MASSIAAAAGSTSYVMSLTFSLVPTILSIIGMWKVFTKAGQPGWAAIIPFYNTYTLFKIVWGNGWLFLLTFIPFGGAIVLLICYYQLAMRFGKSSGFGVGMIFLSWLFIFLLGIEAPQYTTGTFTDMNGNLVTQQYIVNGYQGPRDNGKKAGIITGIIVGVVGTILAVIMTVVIGMIVAQSVSNGDFDQFAGMVGDILEEEGVDTDGLDDLLGGSSALLPGADGKYEDMEALAEAIKDDIQLDDDSMDVEIYGFGNVLYLDMYFQDDIPKEAFEIVASALESAMDSYVEESLAEVFDQVSCEDPQIMLTLYSNDYDEIWSKVYTK